MKNFGKWLEMHVEKVVLGLSGLFLVFVLYQYGIGSPNKLDFAGKPQAPAELHAAILKAAQELDQAISRQEPTKSEIEDFSEKLKKEQTTGVLGATKELSPVLRRTTPFGPSIAVPGLDEAEAMSGPIALITPLPPSQPKIAEGRSLAFVKTPKLGTDERPPTAAALQANADTAGEKPVEVAWVSLGAYFDRASQRTAMLQSGYKNYLANVLVTGVEVERQEQLAGGDWSEWKLVSGAKAMPELTIPEPKITPAGTTSNTEELTKTVSILKSEQTTLMQPAFYKVSAGDNWSIPPIEGHEPPPEDEEAKPKPIKKEEPKQQPVNIAGQGGERGGGGISVTGGGARGGRFAGGGGGAPIDDKAAQKKQAEEDFKAAQEAFRDKQWQTAIDRARAVDSNAEANASQKNRCKKIIEDSEKKLAEQSAAEPVGSQRGIGLIAPTGGERFRGGPPGAAFDATQAAAQAVLHPTNKQPAVWFHDDTVEPGKTYRYRMRVGLWNRYVGQMRALANPEDAKKPVLAGAWSPESEPITVRPKVLFFVTGGRPSETGRVGVEAFAWNAGKWVKQRFEVGVGDVIGGPRTIDSDETDDANKKKKIPLDFTTGAVVLDVKMQMIKVRSESKSGVVSHREQESLVLTYLDPADGQVKTRIQQHERTNPQRKLVDKDES